MKHWTSSKTFKDSDPERQHHSSIFSKDISILSFNQLSEKLEIKTNFMLDNAPLFFRDALDLWGFFSFGSMENTGLEEKP